MTLLISQLSLNLQHREVRRDLGNAYDLHRTLARAFADGPEAAVAYQVTNGKGAMPAFGGKLSEAQIADVAAYVIDQSTKW